MNTQPEALRLADWCNTFNHNEMETIATELRRLHEANEHNRKYVETLEKEVKHLHEANQAMLEALKAIEPYIPTTTAKDGGAARYSANVIAADIVRAAIAKGEHQ